MNYFSNTENAFKLKTNSELKNAYFLFKCIKNPTLTNFGIYILNIIIKWKLNFVNIIIKKTLFKQFCGGETRNECISVVNKMFEKNVCSILDYSVEGKNNEKTFENTYNEILDIIEFSQGKKEIPFVVFKPTGFGRIEIYEKIGKNENLTNEEKQEWKRIINRFDKVCKKAHQKNVPIMIDAEESWMQDSVDNLVEKMMQKYNKNSCIVINTLQMYRTGRIDYLISQHQKAIEGNYFIGYKIVRGAYMEKERERAKKLNYPSPIQKDKGSTDQDYNQAIEYIVTNLDKISLFAGTHNELSSAILIKLLKDKNIQTNFHKIWFGQLYGMSDNISFNLGKDGFNIAKYLPYGPVIDVVPYLMRRAQENTSVAGQTNRELNLIQTELTRRKHEKSTENL